VTNSFTVSPTPAPTSPAGSGTASISPAQVDAGAQGATFTLAYTAGGDAFANGTLIVDIPVGWPAPQETGPASPNFISVTASPGGTVSILAVAGNRIFIQVDNLPAGGSVYLAYGYKGQGGGGVTVPASAGSSVFNVESAPSGAGTAPLGILPAVEVRAVTPVTSGTGAVDKGVAFPNPFSTGPLVMSFRVRNQIASITVTLYTEAYIDVFKKTYRPSGGYGPGWNNVVIDNLNLKNGYYFGILSGGEEQHLLVKLYVLR
jgi:hypothetical protein